MKKETTQRRQRYGLGLDHEAALTTRGEEEVGIRSSHRLRVGDSIAWPVVDMDMEPALHGRVVQCKGQRMRMMTRVQTGGSSGRSVGWSG